MVVLMVVVADVEDHYYISFDEIYSLVVINEHHGLD
jgi:hypothetical protein